MRRLAPVCLALAAALLGCSSGSGANEGDGPAGAKPSGTTAAPRIGYADRLPMARFSYSKAENTAIEAAQEILTQRCLRSYGISYDPVRPDPDAPEPADRRYGLSSASEAARFGYHPNSDAVPDESPDLPQDALVVFYGRRSAEPGGGEKAVYKGKAVPRDGCFGQSVAQLSREYDDPAGAAVASGIATGSYEKSFGVPAVREAFGAWSACMRAAGFRYASPMDPLRNSAFQGGSVSAKEKETATADVRCKESTGLLDIWFDAESRIQQADIAKNAGPLERLRTAHREKAQAARRVVAEG